MLFRYTKLLLWCYIRAGRTDQPEIVPDLSPRGKSCADRWLGIMDPAVHFSIGPPVEEWARGTFFSVGVNPVVDPVNTGQVCLHKVSGGAICPVRKADEHMGEDVLPVACNPWYEIVDDPFLVPPPFLAAYPALPAGLGHGKDPIPEP